MGDEDPLCLFKKALLLVEAQDLNGEWYMKAAEAVQSIIQCHHAVCDERKRDSTGCRHPWIAFQDGR